MKVSGRKKVGVLAIVAILISPVAVAQVSRTIDDAKFLKCGALKNSLERLACFDELAKNLGPPVSIDAKKAQGQWLLRTETSRFDDSKSVYLTLDAKESITGWPGKAHTPSLIIRCQEKKTQAYINFGMSPAVESGLYNQATLQFRIDKRPLFKIAASKSTDGEALFLPDAIGFAKSIIGAQELLVRFVPFNSPPQETSFTVAGIENSIQPVREACKWQK